MSEIPAVLTLSDLLLRAVARHGSRPALSFGDVTLSYAELDRASNAMAAHLRGRDIAPGDSVALHLRNCLEYVIADLAILKLGAVKVPLNELMSPAELNHCLRDADVRALVRHPDLPFPTTMPPGIAVVVAIGKDLLQTDGSASFQRQIPKPSDRAAICYTGGTTGASKGVVHVQSTLAINLLAHCICGDIRADEVMLLTTPLPHSAGFHLQACLLMGGHAVLAERFDPSLFAELTERHRATWSFAVPTMIYRLLDAPNISQSALSSLRTMVYGAAPMNRARLQEALSRFGPIFLQIYGQTESPNFITTLSKTDHLDEHLLTSCGAAVPFVTLEIHDSEGNPLPAGQVGEVAVRSAYALVCYHDNPEATAASILDGALMTGDLGYLDARGYLHLVDRAKDMIITGGMNVYSVEVERVLRSWPGIREAAVVGLPDSDWGERVVAVLVCDDAPDMEELRIHCRAELAAYKIPKSFRVASNLPLTTYGKIDKKAIRTLLMPGRD